MPFSKLPAQSIYKVGPQTNGSNSYGNQPIGSSMVSALQNNPAQMQAVNQPFNPSDEQQKAYLAQQAQSQGVPHTVGLNPTSVGNNPAIQAQTTGAQQQAQEMQAPINDQTPWVRSAAPNAWQQTRETPPEISKRFAGGYFNQWQPGNIWNQSMQNAQYQMPYNPNLKR